VQFPIAKAHMSVEAADLMRLKAATMFDAGEPCGAEANMAKYCVPKRPGSRQCLPRLPCGYGFAAEYDSSGSS